MNTLLRHALFFCILLAFSPAAPADADSGPVIALRGFFTAVVNDDDRAAWAAFTHRTQDGIVGSVAGSEKMGPAEVRKLFDTGDPRLHAGFWKSFHESSQAETFLQVQMTPQGPTQGADGAVLITMPNGNTVTLLMYRESNAWKVGWFETFFPNGLNAS